MSHHATIINQSLHLTPSLYGSTITLHAPANVSSVVTVSGATFIDGSTSKTTTGYITVGPVPYNSNVWNIVDIFPFTNPSNSNNFANVDTITIQSLNIRSNILIQGHVENAGYISVLGTIITPTLTQYGNKCIIKSNLISTTNGLSNTYFVLNSNYLISTISGLGSSTYISSTQLQSTVNNLGLLSYISQASLTSTISGQKAYISSNDLVSSISGLGSIYISSSGLISTFTGLGSFGYLSSAAINADVSNNSFIQGTIKNSLMTMVIDLSQDSNGYISTTQLVSTVQGLGRSGYISTTGLTSTITGVQSINNSSMTSTILGLSSQYYSTGSLVSTVNSVSNTFSSNLVYSYTNVGSSYISTEGLTSAVQGLDKNYVTTGSLTSTITGFADFERYDLINFVNTLESNYINRAGLTSTTSALLTGFSNIVTTTVAALPTYYTTRDSLVSTVVGLGTSEYISSESLISSFNSWSNMGQMVGTIINMENTLPYISADTLTTCNILINETQLAIIQSNINALGNLGYISTLSLVSTVVGLESSGYISSNSLASTTTGLGKLPKYASTINMLGTVGYISTASLISSINNLYTKPLISSVSGFLNTGYINTYNLHSNAYIYSIGGTSIASSSNFFEQDGTVISKLQISTASNIYATTFKTVGYGSNYLYGDGTYLTISSDRRFKENIEEIPTALALEQVLSLRGVYYNKIEDGDVKKYIGCIAQEVEQVYPEVITTHPSIDPPNLKSMKYDFLTSPILQSIKELIYLHSTLKNISVKNQGNIQ